MKKYLIFRFKFYYGLSLLFYVYQIISPVIKDIAFYDNVDSLGEMNIFDSFNFVVADFFIIGVNFLVILPTIAILRMNKNKPYRGYWYGDVLDKEKVYGPIRKFLIISALLFLAVQLCIIVERLVLHRVVFTNFFWLPLTLFLLAFGIVSIMSGIFLELQKNREKYINK